MNTMTCEHVLNMLPLYIDEKTSEEDTIKIKEHLRTCQECYDKYISLKSVAEKIKTAFADISCTIDSDKIFFRNNLSAYIDNELGNSDYYKFSKLIKENQQSKKEYDEMNSFEEKLKKSFQENTKTLRPDLSQNVINEIKRESPAFIYELYVKAALITLGFIFLTAMIGYFSAPDHLEKILTLISLK